MSTFSFSATSLTLGFTLTLKPIIMAPDAEASITSDSVIAPVAECIMLSLTSSVLCLTRESPTASSEPWTSVFRTMLSSFTSPSFILSKRSSRLTKPFLPTTCLWLFSLRCSITCFAVFSSWTPMNSSPAMGTPDMPYISAGMAGPADFIFFPLWSSMALTRPYFSPQTKWSPLRKVPFLMRTVATGPLLLSSFASIMTPLAGLSGLPFSSSISDWSESRLRNSSTPSPVLAEICPKMVSPPHSSGERSNSANSLFTFSWSASGLSILLTATTIGISAARAWLIASFVCGITPSSAATTSTMRSVTLAPLARMAVKASWPGVSRKTMSPLSVLT